jgi:hypothetical protein
MVYTFLIILLCLSVVALALISCVRYLQQQRDEAPSSNRKVKVWLNTLDDGQSALNRTPVLLNWTLINQQAIYGAQHRAAQWEVQPFTEERHLKKRVED